MTTTDSLGLASDSDYRKRVVELLATKLKLDPALLERARLIARRTRRPIEQTLNQMGVVTDRTLAEAYAEICACAVWDPEIEPPTVVDPSIVQPAFLATRRMLVLETAEKTLTVATPDPLDDEALTGLAFASGRSIVLRAATPADFRRAAYDLYGQSEPETSQTEHRLEAEAQRVADVAADSEAARGLAAVLEAAAARRASDIHLEPRRHDAVIRLRVDGRLTEFGKVSPELATALISRIKVISNLDLGERRLPQDGRATFVAEGRPIETRISLVPTVFGESAVLRILDRVGVEFDLNALGASDEVATVLHHAAHTNHGIFLLAGPTGSGKTTTLYALLNSLAGAGKKILSVEDPVEHHFAHVNQIQAAPQIGLTFAHALRAFLRQDPDVILVGEVRDPETAMVAMQAAMTGHLVLASVHAGDAVRVIPRLQDMGVEPYQLAAALRGAAAQRLVRRLCVSCRKPRALWPAERAFVEAVGVASPEEAWEAVGCDDCSAVGFRGRLALIEAFACDEEIADAITYRKPVTVLARLVRGAGLQTIAVDGCRKAAEGLTTFSEVMSVLQT